MASRPNPTRTWRVEAAMETVFWYRRAGEPGHVHTDRILGIKHARLYHESARLRHSRHIGIRKPQVP